jgi:hypothetical protein
LLETQLLCERHLLPTSNIYMALGDCGLSGFKSRFNKKIWFWHHQPSSVPLGHNYSNPSHLGST